MTVHLSGKVDALAFNRPEFGCGFPGSFVEIGPFFTAFIQILLDGFQPVFYVVRAGRGDDRRCGGKADAQDQKRANAFRLKHVLPMKLWCYPSFR